MKKLISLIIIGVISISGCQQNIEESKSENQINQSKEVKFSEIAYNKMPDDMATTINKKAKQILDDTSLAYDEYTKLEFAGETYLVKGSRREISLKESKEKYPNIEIAETIGEYKIKSIVIGKTLSSPYYQIASEEEKAQIKSEGIENEKYKIKNQQIPIIELLYENGENGIVITMQNTKLLRLIKIEENNTPYGQMALPDMKDMESYLKESAENKNLKIYYNQENQKYKSMAFYQEENSDILSRISAGKLAEVGSYGVEYTALEMEENTTVDTRLLDTLSIIDKGTGLLSVN